MMRGRKQGIHHHAFVWIVGGSIAAPVFAMPTLYTDEATYLADLASLGYLTAEEGFEDDNIWGLLEPTATTTVPDVTSHGVRWTGLGGGLDLEHQPARTNDWALESSPAGSPSDGFIATAEQPLFGFGGWLRAGNAGSGGQNDLMAYLNGSAVSVDEFGVPLSSYVFWGVIDPDGISSVRFVTEPVDPPEPGSGDPIDPSKTVFLDDFTLGFATAPSLREPGTGWTATAGGDYGLATNWNGGAAPGTSDNALFHQSSAAGYTVTFAQNQVASQAVIADDRVTFDLGGFEYDLTESDITRESLIVGERPGDSGELTITQGTLQGVNAVVAHSTASTGQLTIDTSADVVLSGAMRVGSGGDGTLTIRNGGTLTSGTGNFIGQLGGQGTVEVSGAGSAWTLSGFSGSIVIGSGGGTGALNVTDGASVSAGSIGVGLLWGNGLDSDIGGSGTVLVNGPGTTLDVRTLTIAQDGTGSMEVSGGAQVTGASATIGVSADGHVVMDGAGTSWSMNIGGSSHGTLFVGAGDQIGSFATTPPRPLHDGTLTIQNGATVQVEQTFIGLTRTGRGVLTVTGPGSTWISGSQFSGNTFIGHEGDGTLNVLAGASVQTGQAFVGRHGLRDQLRGVANIDGPGSTWTSPSTIWVGFNNDPQIYSGAGLFVAEGVLNVSDGGSVSASQLGLASRNISIGLVNISGAGSTISTASVALGKTSTTTFTFGSNAVLTVADGGLLEATGDVKVHHGRITLDEGVLNAASVNLYGAQLTTIDPFELGDTRVELTGNGTINAEVNNLGGFVSPGSGSGIPRDAGTGILRIAGNYTQGIDGTLMVDLNGVVPGTGHDQIAVANTASLHGGLAIVAPTLALGDSFVVLAAEGAGGVQGIFDQTAVSGWSLPGTDRAIAVLYENVNDIGGLIDQVRLLVTLNGDANGDGLVDLLDLDALGASWNQPGTWQNGDFNYDGVVSLLDLDILGANWGGGGASMSPDMAAALAARGIAVPEPGSAAIGLALLGLAMRRRR